ncbi:hypothetical protein OEZ86_001311 [Tetradesmus obliquus]|nr:hypothetical protein OEZ86_001311 [Tetradesmus obliquus]
MSLLPEKHVRLRAAAATSRHGGFQSSGTPPVRGCLQAAAVRTTKQASKQILLPNVTYSVHKSEIDVAELRLLYRRVCAAHGMQGSPIKQQFFQHWQQLSDAEAEHKLQLLLDKSVAVVAAFSREPNLYDEQLGNFQSSQPSSPHSSSSSDSSSNSSTSWPGDAGGAPLWARWQWGRPRRLVGFVRAAGDASLVATIHDLLIHPNMQGYGLGAGLLQRCVNQVSRQGVFDVGLVAPSHLQAFFRSCSFELDREESVPMAISSSWRKDPELINAGLQANPALQKLLHTAMDDEQRRLFTRCG